MKGNAGYAVFFFPQALQVLGDAIKPYLAPGLGESYLLCREIDTGGALVEMTLEGQSDDGKNVSIELLVPVSMIKMVVSARGDDLFGFVPRPPEPVVDAKA